MNIFNKVTLQYLRKNKMRTLVTIIGIMLSTALICAVTTSVVSVKNYAVELIEYSEGSWHGKEPVADISDLEFLKSSDEVSSSGVLSYIGYAEIDSKNEYKPYLYISGFEEDERGIIPVNLLSGRLPQNSSELIVPSNLVSDGKVNYTVGDTLKLGIGDRVPDEDDSKALHQDTVLLDNGKINDDFKTAEHIDIQDVREYTVIGIYERADWEKYSSPGYTALTVPDEYKSDTELSIYFKMKDPKEVFDFFEKNELNGNTHRDLLMLFAVSKYMSFYSVLYGLIAIVIGLIMFGSVMLIYNAFAISVSERVKQFGLLSSIGATKKQLRRMVRFEALVLSAVGIPLGIGLGLLGMWVTFKLLGSSFAHLTGNQYPVLLKLCVSKYAIIAACIIAFITIIISALIPSVRASKVSAVEAIRQNTDIKQKKAVKTPKIVYKLFGFSGVLAHKYFKRSKKKYRTTIVSLFMSIVLFISAYSFTYYLVRSVKETFNGAQMDYEVMIENENGECDPDRVLDIIKNTDHITDAMYYRRDYASFYTDISNIWYYKGMPMCATYSEDSDRADFYAIKYYLQDDEFCKLLERNSLSVEDYMNGDKLAAIAYDDSFAFDSESGKTLHAKTFKKGGFNVKYYFYDEIEGYYCPNEIDEEKDMAVYYKYSDMDSASGGKIEKMLVPLDECYHEKDIRIESILEEAPMCLNDTQLSLIFPISKFDENELAKGKNEKYCFAVNSDNVNQGYDSLQKNLRTNGIIGAQVFNYAADDESDRSLILIIKVFAYGFIVLISLIAVANMFNTVTTNINLRRRDFAMLRSVGMEEKGMRKMLNFECVLYGTKALIYGLPVAVAVTYLIYRTVLNGIDITFTIPWKAVAIAVFSVFAVVFSTMMYSMKKLKNDNPVETLKNENL